MKDSGASTASRPGNSGSGGGGGPGRWVRRRITTLSSPPWLKAPLLLLRFPGLLVAVTGAVFILAIASAAGPLFLSSAGNETLRTSIAADCTWDVGLNVTDTTPLAGRSFYGQASELLRQKEELFQQATASLPNVQPVQIFAVGSTLEADSPEGAAVGPAGPPHVRLVYRDGALDHVTKLESAGGTGVWLPKTAADAAGISAGDEVQLALNGKLAQARVAGIYRDLSTQPRTDFWCQQDSYIYPLSAFDNFVPPPFVLADRQTFIDLGQQLRDQSARFTWEYLPKPGLTVAEAKALGDRLLTQPSAAIRGNADAGGGFGNDYASRFGSLVHIDARYPFLVDRAIAVEESLRGPVDTIGLAGRIVGLIVVAVAGVFWVDRRRSEVALLAAKGAGPFDLGVKVVLEVAIPAALAAAAGAVAARWLVRWLGPIDVFDAPALSDANRQVIVTVAIAVLLFAVVAAVASRRILEVASPRRRDLLTSVPWELVLLGLAGASLYEVLSRTTTVPVRRRRAAAGGPAGAPVPDPVRDGGRGAGGSAPPANPAALAIAWTTLADAGLARLPPPEHRVAHRGGPGDRGVRVRRDPRLLGHPHHVGEGHRPGEGRVVHRERRSRHPAVRARPPRAVRLPHDRRDRDRTRRPRGGRLAG